MKHCNLKAVYLSVQRLPKQDMFFSNVLQANTKILQNHSLQFYKLKNYTAIYYTLNHSVP